tara:strand:- start:56 stop:181 length:126 start_codon:yes stop_codon:yes gene_type:complete
MYSQAGEFIEQQLTRTIPVEIENLDVHIAAAVSDAESSLKA